MDFKLIEKAQEMYTGLLTVTDDKVYFMDRSFNREAFWMSRYMGSTFFILMTKNMSMQISTIDDGNSGTIIFLNDKIPSDQVCVFLFDLGFKIKTQDANSDQVIDQKEVRRLYTINNIVNE